MTQNSVIVAVLLSIALLPVQAQEIVQVVTKTIDRTFAYQAGYELNIEGQKAEINVSTWDKREIKVSLQIIAKHPKLSVAETALETVNFVSQRIRNKVYLRNYRYGEAAPSEAILLVKYFITLPEECPVYVKNYFGSANISNLSNRLRIFGEYSQIDIDNVNGLLDISTRFGDVIGEKIDGNVTINARRSDISLYEISGNYQINAQYGTLKLQPTSRLTGLNVSADKSEVYLIGENPEAFAYTLTATHGQLNTPSNMRLRTLQNTAEVKKIYLEPTRTERFPTITVSVTFGNVHIHKIPKEGVLKF